MKLVSFDGTTDILAVHMHHARDMASEQRSGIATGEHAVTGVEQQAGRLAGASHQSVDVRVALHNRAHVVMKRHAHAECGHSLRQRCHLAAKRRPTVIRQDRPLRDRRKSHAVVPPGGIGIDDEVAAEIAQQREMRFDRREFRRDLAFEDPSVVPAGNQLQSVS